jgi:hypothetical protein
MTHMVHCTLSWSVCIITIITVTILYFYSYDSYSVIIGIGILYYHPITEYNIQKKKLFQTVQTY